MYLSKFSFLEIFLPRPGHFHCLPLFTVAALKIGSVKPLINVLLRGTKVPFGYLSEDLLELRKIFLF